MKIRNSSDWRDALPFDTPLHASEAVPGDPTRCATCGPSSELRDREDLWVVKHRHPNNPAGFVRLYCLAHRPTIASRPAPAPAKAPRERRAASSNRVAAPTIPERPAVFCPDCFVEVPATGVCGMCGQRVSACEVIHSSKISSKLAGRVGENGGMTTTSGSGLAGHAARADAFVERALEAQRVVARAQAAHTAVLAEAHAWATGVASALPGASSRTADLEVRDLAAQLGAALRLSDRAVQRQMNAAASLAALLPATMAAWVRGEIDRVHVAVIVEAGMPLVDPAAREWFESRSLLLAAELTPAQLRPAVRTLAEHAQPEMLDARHARARAGRRVILTDLEDGMARVIADLPAALAYGILDRLTTLAHEVRTADIGGDDPDVAETESLCEDSTEGTRSMDETRADVFTDLLLSGAPTGHGGGLERVTAHVQVTVPVLTALGASREPCILAGYGPIPLADALRLAGAASGWDRVLTSPFDGAVLGVDRYRPTERLRRFLRARDEHCRFVGCRQPVWRCDADHTLDHAHGGETHADNLATLCRRHHVLKHRSEWRVEQLGRGRLRWRSPGGREYVDRPSPTVRFVTADDPPPF